MLGKDERDEQILSEAMREPSENVQFAKITLTLKGIMSSSVKRHNFEDSVLTQ